MLPPRTVRGLVLVVLIAAACSVSKTVPPAVTSPSTTAAPPATTSAAPATTGTDPTTTAPTGPPYPLVSWTLPLVDQARHRPLTTLVWAPDGPGRWPLIVFAHGYQVGPDPYRTLLEAWAAQGYVVAAPEFPFTDEAVAGKQLNEADIDNQPADMRFVTSALIRSGPVADRIDVTRVALAGHSDGADTVLVASLTPSQPPIRAVLAMSVSPPSGTTHLATPPILITQGDADTINSPAEGEQVLAEAANPKYLMILRGGGHLPPLEAGSPWLPSIEATTEAFFQLYLQGKGSPADVLRPEPLARLEQ